MPARAVPLLANWMDAQGFPDKPIGLGEYNGHTAAAIKAAGEAILSTPEVWFGLAWNSTGLVLPARPVTAWRSTRRPRPRPSMRDWKLSIELLQ